MKIKKLLGSFIILASFFVPMTVAMPIVTHTIGDKLVQADNNKVGEGNQWTLYSQLIMGDKKKDNSASGGGDEDDAKSQVLKASGGLMHPISQVTGSQGVSLDLNYTYISQYGKALVNTSGVAYRLAAFLSTYSHYNYFQTVSGNKIAQTASSSISGIFRLIGGLIAVMSQGIESVAHVINNAIGTFFTRINLFSYVGFGKSKTGAKDGVYGALVQTVNTFLDDIGINKDLFKAVMSFSFLIVTGWLAYQLIKAISSKGLVNNSKIWDASKKWLIRFGVFFIAFPVMGALTDTFLTGINDYQKDSSIGDSTVQRFIINDKLWASRLNLSPDGLQNPSNGLGNLPKADSTDNYVDESFAPGYAGVGGARNRREMISAINKNAYAAGGEHDTNAIAFDLIGEWLSNSNFNINSYAGEVAIGSGNIAIYNYTKVNNNKSFVKFVNNKDVGQARLKDLAGYVWSADQSPDDKTSALPDGKSQDDSVDFNPKSDSGIKQNDSFSTQTVALLLQSAFDSDGGHFYAYNIAPTGVQGKAKNLSTVKTEWRTASFVGTPIGQIGGFVNMVSMSLGKSLLYLAAAWALLTINLFEALKTFFKNLWVVMLTGNAGAACGSLALGFGTVITGIIAIDAPPAFVTQIDTIVRLLVSTGLSKINYDGLSDLLSGILGLWVAYLLAKGKKGQDSPLKMLISFPMNIALEFDKKVKMYFNARSSEATRLLMRSSKGALKRNEAALSEGNVLAKQFDGNSSPSPFSKMTNNSNLGGSGNGIGASPIGKPLPGQPLTGQTNKSAETDQKKSEQQKRMQLVAKEGAKGMLVGGAAAVATGGATTATGAILSGGRQIASNIPTKHQQRGKKVGDTKTNLTGELPNSINNKSKNDLLENLANSQKNGKVGLGLTGNLNDSSIDKFGNDLMGDHNGLSDEKNNRDGIKIPAANKLLDLGPLNMTDKDQDGKSINPNTDKKLPLVNSEKGLAKLADSEDKMDFEHNLLNNVRGGADLALGTDSARKQLADSFGKEAEDGSPVLDANGIPEIDMNKVSEAVELGSDDNASPEQIEQANIVKGAVSAGADELYSTLNDGDDLAEYGYENGDADLNELDQTTKEKQPDLLENMRRTKIAKDHPTLNKVEKAFGTQSTNSVAGLGYKAVNGARQQVTRYKEVVSDKSDRKQTQEFVKKTARKDMLRTKVNGSTHKINPENYVSQYKNTVIEKRQKRFTPRTETRRSKALEDAIKKHNGKQSK